MNSIQMIIFAVIVMGTYFIEGLIGFGGTIMAIPLASEVVGLRITIPVLTIVVLFASIVIAVRDRRHIHKKELIKIVSLMVLGLPIGMYLFKSLPERPLKIALGIFMIIIGVKGVFDEIRKKSNDGIIKSEEKVNNKIVGILENLMIFFGGIVHGAFTCGGPFVVVYATKNLKDKHTFRATLCALWALLNGVMLSMNIVNKEIDGSIVKLSIITIIFVTISIKISNMAHRRINGDAFTKFVYVALTLSGILMMR